MKRYYILMGHLIKQKDELLPCWKLRIFCVENFVADNKRDAKRKIKQRFKNSKNNKYVLLEIERQALF